jgi:hypothetical protein
MNIVGPLPQTQNGNKYILTFQDTFTRYPEAVALPDQKAETVAHAFVSTIICRYGAPESLLTDRGTNFTSTLMKKLCEFLRVPHILTSPYHPAGNGHLERIHKDLANVIKQLVSEDQRDWDTFLSLALFVYRNTWHSAIQCTPSEMVYGKYINLPWPEDLRVSRSYNEDPDYVARLMERLAKLHSEAIIANRRAVQRQQTNYNKTARDISLAPGDSVYYKNLTPSPKTSKKLNTKWLGPYTVVKIRSPTTLSLKDENSGREFITHHSNIVKSSCLDLPIKSSDLVPINEEEISECEAKSSPGAEKNPKPVVSNACPGKTAVSGEGARSSNRDTVRRKSIIPPSGGRYNLRPRNLL